MFFIIGASGVGKSVLIKHLVGLLSPDGGEIWLDGEEISSKDEHAMYAVRKKCAMVFQHSTLFDSMTCVENVALPLRKHKGLRTKDALAEARRRLEIVHMHEFADHYPARARRRHAQARRHRARAHARPALRPLRRADDVARPGERAARRPRSFASSPTRSGVTSIVVSHDLASIFSIADRVVMLYKGKVRLLGTPDAFEASADGVVQQFIHGRAEGPMEL